MSSNGKRGQFDPVASAALAAVRTTNRTTREAQRRLGAPELPAQNSVRKNLTTGIETASQFSPFNVLAKGELPIGNGSQSALPDLPGQSTLENAVPDDVASVMPGGEKFPDPLGVFEAESPVPTPPPNGNGGKGGNGGSRGRNGGNGGGNNGQLGEQSGQFSGVQ